MWTLLRYIWSENAADPVGGRLVRRASQGFGDGVQDPMHACSETMTSVKVGG